MQSYLNRQASRGASGLRSTHLLHIPVLQKTTGLSRWRRDRVGLDGSKDSEGSVGVSVHDSAHVGWPTRKSQGSHDP